MISQGIGWGVFKSLGQWGKSKCQRENRENFQLPILSFVPSHPKVVELVNAWGWEEYGIQIRIWKATHFWEICF